MAGWQFYKASFYNRNYFQTDSSFIFALMPISLPTPIYPQKQHSSIVAIIYTHSSFNSILIACTSDEFTINEFFSFLEPLKCEKLSYGLA